MQIVKIKKSPGPSGTFQDDVVRHIRKFGPCDIFHLKKAFPDAKLVSIQRALDINKHRGFLVVVSRDTNFRFPLGGDLRSLAGYAATDLAATGLPPSPIDLMLLQQRKIIEMQKSVTRNPDEIEQCTKTAIGARAGLDLVWSSLVSNSID